MPLRRVMSHSRHAAQGPGGDRRRQRLGVDRGQPAPGSDLSAARTRFVERRRSVIAGCRATDTRFETRSRCARYFPSRFRGAPEQDRRRHHSGALRECCDATRSSVASEPVEAGAFQGQRQVSRVLDADRRAADHLYGIAVLRSDDGPPYERGADRGVPHPRAIAVQRPFRPRVAGPKSGLTLERKPSEKCLAPSRTATSLV